MITTKNDISLSKAYKMLWEFMDKKDKTKFFVLTFCVIIRCFTLLMATQVLACIVAKLEGNPCNIFGIVLPDNWSVLFTVIFCFALVALAWVISVVISDFIKIYSVHLSCKVNSVTLNYLLTPRKNLDYKMTNGEAVFIAKSAGESVIYLVKDLWLKIFVPIVSCAIALVYIAIIDWVCFFIYFACFALIIVSIFIRLKFEAKIDNKIEDSKSQINNHYLSNIVNLPLITMLNTKEHEGKILNRQNKIYEKHWHKVTNLAMWYWIIAHILEYAFVALGVVVCILRTGLDSVSVANIVALVSYSSQLCSPLESIGIELALLQQRAIQLTRLNLLEVKPKDMLLATDPENKKGTKLYSFPNDVKIKDITISNLHIKIKNFEKTYNKISLKTKSLNIITGESGCGKTSFIHALLGLKTYESGDIVINNKYLIKSLYGNKEKVSFVMQNEMIFDRSVVENIAYPSNRLNAKALKYIKTFDLESLIEREKSDTNVYTTLSGGEQKRISLIRGMAKDADIYIFDEPTNDLDNENATKVVEEIKKLSSKNIVVVISHDKRLIDVADNLINI